VVCCSKAVERWVLEKENLPPGKVSTIHTGVDLQRFRTPADGERIRREFGIPPDALVVGTVANFAFEKGYPALLEAAEISLKINKGLWFLLVGSGPLEKEVRGRVKKILGHERIVFTGSRWDIPDLMEAMDVFVLASVIEGFPNVLLEAMAMTKAVIATSVGGIPELIESGENGILVPPSDGKALAQAILSLLEDRGKRAELGARAQEKMREEFTLDRMLNQYEALYLSLLREKGIKKEDRICAASSELSILK
jgi:glycosyltransferase involved in cell wall biosynthesis